MQLETRQSHNMVLSAFSRLLPLAEPTLLPSKAHIRRHVYSHI